MTPPQSEITALLLRVRDGDPASLDALLPLVYAQLRQMAAAQLRHERPGHTLNPTDLVHEAFLRMIGPTPLSAESRAHFFGIAARAMRRILVDHARRRQAHKRSRDQEATLDTAAAQVPAGDADLLGVDQALERLAALSPRQAQVVEMRYFAGFSLEETAATLGISLATVKRDWTLARAWLQRELSRDA